jgi:16S rRNA (guanine(966)-N(2))-methyltransferase RsmD
MRIISGTFKGRNIEVPKNFDGRPTTDFARESLFNILSHQLDMDGATVLDLFAGTGAVSLECLSRGAQHVQAVEMSPVHVKFIQKNFELFNFDNGDIIRGDVFKFLVKPLESFDMVFADPPYDVVGFMKLPSLVLDNGWVKKGGLFVLEHPDKMDFSNHPFFSQHRRYGSVNFTFFKVPEE